MATFYSGQTDYIEKLNDLALVQATYNLINPATGDIFAANNISAPSFSIQTNTTPAVFIKDDNLTSWDYSGKSFSINAQETGPAGIFLKPDGLAMYVIGTTGDDVNQYSLSVAWDVSTAAFVQVSDNIGEPTPSGLFFKQDGLAMYVIGTNGDAVREFSLSSAWDVSTLTFVQTFSVSAQDSAPQDLWFKPDGTKMYVVGSTGDDVNEYDLSIAWNVSSAVFLQNFSVAAQDTVPAAINFNADGTKMYILGQVGQDINRYSLSTPWDISTAVFFNNFYVGFQATTPSGMFINFDGDTAYVVGSSTDSVHQYTTITDGIELVSSSGLFVDGGLYTNKNLFVTAGTRIDGTLSVSSATTLKSSLTVTGAVTMSSTTGAINIGTSQSTGATIIGGIAQTGGLTLGRSTGAQTVDIAVGATTNDTIKLINVGANGVSGSITNVNIGSTVTGALGTLSINSKQTAIASTDNASSTITGALVVHGGVGISGDLYVGGTVYGASTNADNIRTIQRSTNANHFLTFVDSDNASNAYEALYTDAGISYNPSTNSLTISGNLTVNGTTTTVNSTTVTLDDPILTLGGDTAPVLDDNKDRGIEFRWYDGTAKVGFFGFADSTGKLTFIPDATNTTEVFSGTKGTIDANLEWADVLNKPDPVVTVTLTGDVTGTANTTLTDLASGTISIATTNTNNTFSRPFLLMGA